ncbi:MAG: chemotaxis protein CheW [Candidatus Dadabacteria bacterium]|nr:MAG: chemotaxis protein CheW [Candidatus Dadabacteria bacterium]
MSPSSEDLSAWLEAVRAEYWNRQDDEETELGSGSLHLLVEAGGRRLAVPAAAAKGVVRRPRVTRLPGVPPHVLGVAGVRGEVVSVVDTNRFLGFPPSQGGYLVLVASGPVRAAFTVDRIVDVVPVPDGEVRPVEAPWPNAPEGVVTGQWDTEPPVALLDPDALVRGSAVPETETTE